jgi:hypothetical protein
MTASRAILYCTVNGVCNNTNGLGRQTKTLLSALTRHGAELTRVVGPFDVHVVCLQPGADTWAFNLVGPLLSPLASGKETLRIVLLVSRAGTPVRPSVA